MNTNITLTLEQIYALRRELWRIKVYSQLSPEVERIDRSFQLLIESVEEKAENENS